MSYRQIVNPVWRERIEDLHRRHQPIDEVVKYNPATQWLIGFLAMADVPFRVYNLGAGVKRVTTDATHCPCCKRTLS